MRKGPAIASFAIIYLFHSPEMINILRHPRLVANIISMPLGCTFRNPSAPKQAFWYCYPAGMLYRQVPSYDQLKLVVIQNCFVFPFKILLTCDSCSRRWSTPYLWLPSFTYFLVAHSRAPRMGFGIAIQRAYRLFRRASSCD